MAFHKVNSAPKSLWRASEVFGGPVEKLDWRDCEGGKKRQGRIASGARYLQSLSRHIMRYVASLPGYCSLPG